jgi:hypothetical protein
MPIVIIQSSLLWWRIPPLINRNSFTRFWKILLVSAEEFLSPPNNTKDQRSNQIPVLIREPLIRGRILYSRTTYFSLPSNVALMLLIFKMRVRYDICFKNGKFRFLRCFYVSGKCPRYHGYRVPGINDIANTGGCNSLVTASRSKIETIYLRGFRLPKLIKGQKW